MLVIFNCPHCRAKVRSSDVAAGSIIPCTNCQKNVIVPGESSSQTVWQALPVAMRKWWHVRWRFLLILGAIILVLLVFGYCAIWVYDKVFPVPSDPGF